MHKPIYRKLAADGSALPADHPNEGPDKHLAVRIEHVRMATPFIVSAYRLADEVKFADVAAICAKYNAYGRSWRPLDPEEGFFIPDRTSKSICLDTNFFPDAVEYEWTWTGEVYAPRPSDDAWVVGLGSGGASWFFQSGHYGVRAVCAGQS